MRWGLDLTFPPGEAPEDRLSAARDSGADFVRWAISNAGLDALSADPAIRAPEARVPVEAVHVSGLVRFSEIYTHPASRALTLRRLDAALALASKTGVETLSLAVKELVPAEVAIPAYRVGLGPAALVAKSLGMRLVLEPIGGWPAAEALDLLSGLGDERIGWVLPLDPSAGARGAVVAFKARWPNAVRLAWSPGDAAASIDGLQALVELGWDGPVVVDYRNSIRSEVEPSNPSASDLRGALGALRSRF